MINQILYSTAALIALIAPVVELPIFIALMEGRTPRELRRAAVKVAGGSFAILALSAVAGTRILETLGVSLGAFRSAGGLVLILIGLQMLQGKSSPVVSDRGPQPDPEDHLWVPLVMPLIAGPAAITTVITLSIQETSSALPVPLATLIAIVIATSVVLLILLFADPLSRAVKPRVARILERFFGLMLVAIGFQMGYRGIEQFFLGRP